MDGMAQMTKMVGVGSGAGSGDAGGTVSIVAKRILQRGGSKNDIVDDFYTNIHKKPYICKSHLIIQNTV